MLNVKQTKIRFVWPPSAHALHICIYEVMLYTLYCIYSTCTLSSLTHVNVILTSVMGYLKPCWADTKYSVIFKHVCILYINVFYVFHIYILAVV